MFAFHLFQIIKFYTSSKHITGEKTVTNIYYYETCLVDNKHLDNTFVVYKYD